MRFAIQVITGLAIITTLLLPSQVQPHRFSPSLLTIVDTSQHNYNLVWKTPAEATSNAPTQPTCPVSFVVNSESPAVREGTGTLSS
jgi:hypothetical protein